MKNNKWTWWDEIKNITEEIAYPIITITILITETILAIAYINLIIVAIWMIFRTLLLLL